MRKGYPNNHQEEPLDPQLGRLLETLRPVPDRDPQAAERGRARFLAELEVSAGEMRLSANPPTSRRSLFSWFKKGKKQENIWEGNNVTRPQRFAFTSLALVILVAAVLFGGAGAAVAAAQGSLPGDALYPVKTGIEQTRLSLAQDAGDRAQMKMEFAERRLKEIEALVQERRYDGISAAAQKFEAEIFEALSELKTVSEGDPVRAADIAAQITAALSRYAQTLSLLAANAPETVRGELDRALQTARTAGASSLPGAETEFQGVVEQIGPEAWIISGIEIVVRSGTEIKGSPGIGDEVKVHFSLDETGQRVAREIEPANPASVDDNANVNANDNSANDTGSNANANDDDDDNGNSNVNSNSNDTGDGGNSNEDDDNSNDNGDDNGNDNGDDGGDDDSGGDDNGNDNGDDGSSNDNEDDGGNDNGDDDGNDNGDDDGNRGPGSGDDDDNSGDDGGSSSHGGDDDGGDDNSGDDDNSGKGGGGDDDDDNDNENGG